MVALATKGGSSSGMKYYVSLSIPMLPTPSGKQVLLSISSLEAVFPSALVMFIAKYTATASPSCILPRRGEINTNDDSATIAFHGKQLKKVIILLLTISNK